MFWETSLKKEEIPALFSQFGLSKKKIKYFWDSPGLKLDLREDIKLFLKLPEKFTIDTPFVKYIPDWAIAKHNDDMIYMVCETKGVTLTLRRVRSDYYFPPLAPSLIT